MVFPQFKNSFPDRCAVTEQPGLEAPQANTHSCLSWLVLNGSKPIRERLTAVFRLVSEEFEHPRSVAYKLHARK